MKLGKSTVFALAGMHAVAALAAPARPLDVASTLPTSNTIVTARAMSAFSESAPQMFDVEHVIKGAASLASGQLVRVTLPAGVSGYFEQGAHAILFLDCDGLSCRPASSDGEGLLAPEMSAPMASSNRQDAIRDAVVDRLVASASSSDGELSAAAAQPLSPELAEFHRRLAAQALMKFPAQPVLESIGRVRKTLDVNARLSIASVLLHFGDASALMAVEKDMRDRNVSSHDARVDLAWTVASLDTMDERLVPVFASWLQSPEDELRVAAAYALRVIGKPSVIKPIFDHGLADGNREVRYYLVTALQNATTGSYVGEERFFSAEKSYLDDWSNRKDSLERSNGLSEQPERKVRIGTAIKK